MYELTYSSPPGQQGLRRGWGGGVFSCFLHTLAWTRDLLFNPPKISRISGIPIFFKILATPNTNPRSVLWPRNHKNDPCNQSSSVMTPPPPPQKKKKKKKSTKFSYPQKYLFFWIPPPPPPEKKYWNSRFDQKWSEPTYMYVWKYQCTPRGKATHTSIWRNG